jgi:CRP-like cAMP-binding protein
VIFRKGDRSDTVYILGEGTVWLPEVEKSLAAGALFGEIGIFTADRRRTATAVCKTRCEIYTISEEDILRLIVDEPAFGLYLMKLIVKRLHPDAWPPRRAPLTLPQDIPMAPREAERATVSYRD